MMSLEFEYSEIDSLVAVGKIGKLVQNDVDSTFFTVKIIP